MDEKAEILQDIETISQLEGEAGIDNDRAKAVVLKLIEKSDWSRKTQKEGESKK